MDKSIFIEQHGVTMVGETFDYPLRWTGRYYFWPSEKKIEIIVELCCMTELRLQSFSSSGLTSILPL